MRRIKIVSYNKTQNNYDMPGVTGINNFLKITQINFNYVQSFFIKENFRLVMGGPCILN